MMACQKECESCLVAGEHVPATTRSINPDFSGYALCADCAAEYDSRINKIIQYWTHTPDGETYAVMPGTKQCFGPLHYSEIGKITADDERWSNEDWEWLNNEPCVLYED